MKTPEQCIKYVLVVSNVDFHQVKASWAIKEIQISKINETTGCLSSKFCDNKFIIARSSLPERLTFIVSHKNCRNAFKSLTKDVALICPFACPP